MLSEERVLDNADERIQKHRMGDVVLTVTDSAGDPIADAEVEAQQTNHAFLFGCTISLLDKYEDDEKNRTYEELFTGLLNFATLGFYWSRFEPEQDKPDYEYMDWLAKQCQKLGLATKGHPLVWHHLAPDWVPTDMTVLQDRLRKRVTDIVQHYRGLVDIWDVVNEATYAKRSDSPVGEWINEYGDDVCVGLALDWAHEANPDALLVNNDFNICPTYEKQLERLKAAQKPFDAIGLQSHMHSEVWELSRVWEICETYKRFGVPLHFSEVTVLSGSLRNHSERERKRHINWVTTEEGEKSQLEYVQKFYRLLFSHPSVEAITWWNLPDNCWRNAPGGLVRADLTPKPIYERLVEMVKGEWWTQEKGRTDGKGQYRFRGFCGEYDVTVRDSQESFALSRGENGWAVRLNT